MLLCTVAVTSAGFPGTVAVSGGGATAQTPLTTACAGVQPAGSNAEHVHGGAERAAPSAAGAVQLGPPQCGHAAPSIGVQPPLFSQSTAAPGHAPPTGGTEQQLQQRYSIPASAHLAVARLRLPLTMPARKALSAPASIDAPAHSSTIGASCN